ncbi:MAG: GHKL domain-containing protein [Chitinophagaceae bacterium]|nr:MAG: GHKL domain-containing protein [Chitinophagaceae bacterium]
MDTATSTILEMNDRLRQMECYLNNTVLPQIYVDNDMKLRKLTPTAINTFALKPQDEGRRITELKEHFRFTKIQEDIAEVLATGEPLEKEVQSSDSTWYQMKVTPYYDPDHQVIGTMITFIDISEKVQQLRTLENLLQQNETILDTISHDIKSPLTNLLLAIEEFSAMKKESFERAQQFAQLISRSIKKMERVIGDLTDMRKTSSMAPEQLDGNDIARILEDVYLSLHQDIRQSQAEFEFKPHIEHFCYSKQKLRSILFNLINNAIKYKADGRMPRVRIEAATKGSEVEIRVHDNGKGIETTNLEKVFDKYFRVEHNSDGTGMGLYLVKQLVEKDGGRIELKSIPGDGTEFRIILPAGEKNTDGLGI